MKKLLILALVLSIATFFVGCDEHPLPTLPSKETVAAVIKRDTALERVDATVIDSCRRVFKKALAADMHYIDLQSEFIKKMVKDDPDYKGIYCNYYANLTNDTVLMVTEFVPFLEKMEQDGKSYTIYPRDRKYIFHTNGDIEIGMGNMVSPNEDPNDGRFLIMYIDGHTGAVVYFWKKGYAEDNSYRIKPSGTVHIGDDYEKIATEVFKHLPMDMSLIQTKLTEKEIEDIKFQQYL